jgi:RNA polymerase I-specific transcription initiation factor RRN6
MVFTLSLRRVWTVLLTCAGDSFVNFTFETGSEKYAELQNGTYVAAGHFVKGEGEEGTVVEYKVSKVVYKA